MTVTVHELPSPLSLYLKAAGSATRRPGVLTSLPPLSLRLPGVRTDRNQLAAYCEVCGMAAGETLPITYPQVAVAALHMLLMTEPKFPMPLLGLVHVSNRITQLRPLSVDDVYDAEVRIGEARQVRAGLEFDLLTDVSVEGEVIWQAVTTIIHRQKRPGTPEPRRQAPPPAEPAPLAEYATFPVPADTGRRYARVSGDYNPIHLYAATAKLFGFPRAIAHGMWSLARCVGALEARLTQAPRELTVHFKQPLLLPGKVALRSVADASGVEFALLSSRSGKAHLQGSLR